MSVASKTTRLWKLRRTVWVLVIRDLKVRYASSVLGYIWSVLDPLAMSAIYLFVFVVIFHRGDIGHKPYFLFLIVGTLMWQWFSSAVNDTCRALSQEAKLVRSTSLPREIWVVRVVLSKTVEYVLSLPVLVFFTALYLLQGKAHVNARLVLFLAGFALCFVLLIGLGLLLAPINALVADTARVVRILLRMVFYFSPIIYDVSRLPHALQRFMWINPLTGVLQLLRAGFFPQPVKWEAVVVGVMATLVVFLAGVFTFGRLEKSVLKEI